MRHLFFIAITAVLAINAGCGGKGMQPKSAVEQGNQRIADFEKIQADHLTVYPSTTTATKQESEQYIKILSQYIKVGQDALKIANTKSVNLEKRETIEQRIAKAKEMLQEFKNRLAQIEKDSKG